MEEVLSGQEPSPPARVRVQLTRMIAPKHKTQNLITIQFFRGFLPPFDGATHSRGRAPGPGRGGFIGVRSRCEPTLEVGDWGQYNILHSQSLILEVNHEQNSKWMFKKCKLSTTRTLLSHQHRADCFPPSRISNWKFLLRRLETCSRVIIKTPPAAQFILSSQLTGSNLEFFNFENDVHRYS